jgi:hypothetical protein
MSWMWLWACDTVRSVSKATEYSAAHRRQEGARSEMHVPNCSVAALLHEIRAVFIPSKFQKFYEIFRHIKSLDAYMEH